jgi:hypothetical protein
MLEQTIMCTCVDQEELATREELVLPIIGYRTSCRQVLTKLSVFEICNHAGMGKGEMMTNGSSRMLKV